LGPATEPEPDPRILGQAWQPNPLSTAKPKDNGFG